MGYDWATGSGVGAGVVPQKWRKSALVVAAQLVCLSSAFAFEFDTGNDDLKIHWDNSVKYSAAFRVRHPSAALTADQNEDDGDRNFSKRGLISNRLDLLSDLDVVFQGNFGARISGAAWYDSVYNHDTHNDSPNTNNATSVPASEFTDAARKIHGRKAEVLDAFLFAKGELGDSRWSVKGGRHTVLWGETLFFGSNGIAGGQAPIDLVKLLSVPGSQFKEIIRPVGQLSGSFQVAENVLVGGYYQYRWEASRLPSVGSYFASQDIFPDGENFLLAGNPAPAPPPAFVPLILAHGPDLKPKDSGQGGLQMRFRLPDGQTDYGLYAIRYHEKIFSGAYLNFNPFGGVPTIVASSRTYTLDYHEGVRAFGFSASRTFGDVNLATEVSFRRNSSLVSDPVLNAGPTLPTKSNPLYAVGNTAHINISSIWTLPSTPLFNEGLFLGELAWNRATSVTNGGTVAANSSRDAYGVRFILTPTYRQVFSGMDVDVPIGVGYNPEGRSQAVGFFNGGMSKGGDLSVGLAGNYLNAWKLGLNFTHYFGSEAPPLNAAGQLTFQQSLRDRDFVSLSVQTTF